MRIIYYLYEKGEEPSAAWNRVELIIKGCKVNGVEAIVYPIKSPYGINRALRPFILLWQVIKLYFDLFLNKDNAIVCYGYNYTWPLFFLPRRAKLYVERNEYPDHLIRPGKNVNRFEESPLKYIEGFITCSSSLKDYYSGFCRLSCRFLISPVIVDIDEFHKPAEKNKKISYCGDWGNHKDGVDILIEAFSLFYKKHSDYRLELIGGSTSDVEEALMQLSVNLGVDSSIDFVGRIPHEEMADHLLTASVLALARPNNKQAQGGFPSKVAEYLATGRPVVLTCVGDLPLYLTDYVNCFMSAPDSPNAFAEKLCEAVESPNSDDIANKGYELAKTFNYNHQSKMIVDFIG